MTFSRSKRPLPGLSLRRLVKRVDARGSDGIRRERVDPGTEQVVASADNARRDARNLSPQRGTRAGETTSRASRPASLT